MTIRQPIVTVCGHVDHGKTSILDRLRQSSIQEAEAGGITQKISFTTFPADKLKSTCPLIEQSGIKLEIPGFLFIDTPGHAAFSNLRKRGGSLADLAVLVIDINEGIKPQTAEVIQILKHNKTPFIIALNKIDNISGWRSSRGSFVGGGERVGSDKNCLREAQTGGSGRLLNQDASRDAAGKKNNPSEVPLKQNIESQPINTKQNFDEKYLTLIGSLNSHGFDADLFYNIKDFTKKIALVPCSAKTGEGIPELTMMLCGLSQKYLADKLKLNKDAKGVILEIKKEKSINYIEAILYDGELNKENEIAVANLNGKSEISKIRILEEILPLSSKFSPKEKVHASTGIRMQLIEKINVTPGMPFIVYKNNKSEIEKQFKAQISENIKTEKQGIIAKADSLGSLEALLVMLKQERIPVVKAGIGSINKKDIISAKANLKINELDAVIVGFNVEMDEDAEEELTENKEFVKVITDKVIYKLIENLVKFRSEKQREIEKQRLMELAHLCKLRILPQYVFRNTNPAVFGVKVEIGKLKSNLNLINKEGEEVGRTKNIQAEKKSVEEATAGMEVAISLPGVNFERQIKNTNTEILYSNISESQFKKFKKNKDLLSGDEISLLQEIAEIKRKQKSDWGI